MKTTIKHFLQELFFPSFCLGCQKEGTYLCIDCKATLDIGQYQYCLCNKNPLRLPPNEVNRGKCQKCQHEPLFGLYFALPYKEKFLTRKLIYQFKYEPYIKELAKPLAGILTEHLMLIGKNTNQTWDNSVLIPVPMEIKKLKKRGYNQAELLAKELGHKLNVPSVCDVLIKVKQTPPQMELSKSEREKNLTGAFQTKNFKTIAGKNIFLVDDVYTTGSTMQECARVLRDAGAKSVWGLAIARES